MKQSTQCLSAILMAAIMLIFSISISANNMPDITSQLANRNSNKALKAATDVKISSGKQFAQFATDYNSGKYDGVEVNAQLTDDIDFMPRDLVDGDSKLISFVPIGTVDRPFVGTFDGNGYAIKNVNYAEVNDSIVENLVGVFRSIGKQGVVKRLSIVKFDLSYTVGILDGERVFIGIIAGQNQGTITECCIADHESAISVYESQSLAAASTAGVYAGGVVGVNAGTISNCYSRAHAVGSYSIIWGDLCAYNSSGSAVSNTPTIPQTREDGDKGVITNCYSIAWANKLYGNDSDFKTFVNYNEGTINGYCIGLYSSSMSNPTPNDGDSIAYYQYYYYKSRFELLDTAKNSELQSRLKRFIAYEGCNMVIDKNHNDGLPIFPFSNEYVIPYANGQYIISNVKHFNLISQYVDGTNLDGTTLAKDAVFVLVNNIQLSANDSVCQIPTFNYTFDGQGHSIYSSNQYREVLPTIDKNGNESHSLFGTIKSDGIVKNLISSTSHHISESNVANSLAVGGIADKNYGLIKSCAYTGSADMGYSDPQAVEGSTAIMGGIAASNYGTIESCYNRGNLDVYDNSADYGLCHDSLWVGGIAGYNEGKIIDAFNLYDLIYKTKGLSNAVNAEGKDVAVGNIVGYWNSGELIKTYGIVGDPVEDVDFLVGKNSKGDYVEDNAAMLLEIENKFNQLQSDPANPTGENLKNFKNPYAWVLGIENYLNYPRLSFMETAIEQIDGKDVSVVHITDSTSLEQVRDVVNSINALNNQDLVISLDTCIVMPSLQTQFSDILNVDATTVPVWEPIGSAENPFEGKFIGNGNTITNLCMKVDNSEPSKGLFGALADSAFVSDLSVDSCYIIVDMSNVDLEADTIDVGGFAGVNNGTLKNCTFMGVISYTSEPSANINQGLFVGCNNGVIDHCIAYIPEEAVPDDDENENKACIAIKSTIFSGRGSGSTKKSCSTGTGSRKSITGDPEESDLFEDSNKDFRTFTYEEFANGDAAYWLNYNGVGYNGEYSGMWSQGKKMPVLTSTTKDGALYKVVASNVNNDETHGMSISGKVKFANLYSKVSLSYIDNNKPIKLTINGKELETTSTVVTLSNPIVGEGIIKIESTFEANAILTPTTTDRVYAIDGGVRVESSASKPIQIFSLAGSKVLDAKMEIGTNNYKLPSMGIYIVKIDNKASKVVVR